MIARRPHIYRLEIGHGASDRPAPARQTNAQQNGTAYIWRSTTQELLPILPKDHPDYKAEPGYGGDPPVERRGQMSNQPKI